MALLKSTFKRWNGSTWDIHYFRTSADVIDETTSYKVMTSAERTAIANYLNTFNAASKLLQLDGTGKIPVGLIPGGLNYLTISNPSFTGTLQGTYQEGIWAQDDTLYRLRSHASGTAGSGTPGYIEFTSGQGDFVNLKLSAQNITIDSVMGVSVAGKKITNVNHPTNPQDAANKSYVDGLIASGTRPVDPVKAATTGSITLSGLQDIDGYMTVAGDRILVKNQATASQNGIYTASATAWSKVAADSTTGKLTFVEHGTVNNDSQFYATTDTSWSLFSRVDTVTANGGLQKIGTNISVASLGITNAMLAGNISISKLANSTINDNLGAFSNPSYPAANAQMGFVAALNASLSAIRQIRGTAAYNTDNAQTIAGAYNIAEQKNRTYVGGGDPATTGFVEGDLYLQDISVTP